MPDSKCDESFAPNNNEVVTSTGPLHVITQYAGTDISNIMQSPSRPTSLGLCLSNNHPEFKSSLSFRGGVSQEGCYQSWTARGVDTAEFEKLLGNLGNNGSTPVTPTSFLNPNNITEDQEQFADNFSRTLNKVKAEQEGWSTISNSSSLDGDLRGAANPTFAKQIQINRIASMPFIENYTTGTDNSNTIESENGQIKSPLHISDSTEVNSPRLTDRPLVLLPNTSNTTHTTHSGVNSLRKHSTNSKCSSSTSIHSKKISIPIFYLRLI
ncbi:unnamed protein product [Heterobilharzia americana]|nr:unnamed protein product [Heterobilharzia americana]